MKKHCLMCLVYIEEMAFLVFFDLVFGFYLVFVFFKAFF
jgi:hypothetical protein